MNTTDLSEAEAAFAQHLADVIEGLSSVQAEAAKVIAAGGDVRRAFLSIIPEEERDLAELQWPMISMLLGAM